MNKRFAIFFLKSGFAFFAICLLVDCDKSGGDITPIIEFEVTVVDTTIVKGVETKVDGLTPAGNIFMFDNSTDYDNAIVQRTNITGKNYIQDFQRLDVGKYYFKVSNPDIDYYIFALAEDANKKLNVSNFGISGKLNLASARGKGVKRSRLILKLYIQPIDGNIIFYSNATNTFPLTVTMTNFGVKGNSSSQVIPVIFSGSGTPDALSLQGSVRFQRDPGKYAYYAKSNDGCAWAGVVELFAGQAVPVNLSKCENGKLSFYTLSSNSALLPITVTINGQNLGDKEVSTLTSSIASMPGSCNPSGASQITFSRASGNYSYFARSADTSCVWTGNLDLKTDDCRIIELVQCK
ncbi:MAG: hypothetical protein SFY32_08105 [Bacteroidota bacterium]|nr:hypothetical protein [Bacteroidota bacterium]